MSFHTVYVVTHML